MFTRQHYIALAKMIYDCTDYIPVSSQMDERELIIRRYDFITKLCDYFKQDNERFDSRKFRNVCLNGGK